MTLSFFPAVHQSGSWLTVDLGQSCTVAGWPVVGTALGGARHIAWLQVKDADLPRSIDPDAFFLHRARNDGIVADIGLLTAAAVSRFAHEQVIANNSAVTVVVTAGLGNGESVIPSTERESPSIARVGTVNILAVYSHSLTTAALMEAISIVTEARTAAIMELRQKTVDGRIMTGTGTDCILVAAPVAGGAPQAHCGLHTALGRSLGNVTYRATRTACLNWLEDVG